ncbi:MobV family relaxase [Segatella copri]|uniref:Plasmid recombination protein n=1 Tax=Segatella copri TaxID=165179 RepID=A0AAW5UYV5_9BACT|nr:MobV family relaxase [Segatella copri]MCW4142007.1 plasmid recombination protein [Segatella copri]MCW4166531.1 plasmid recombination protein [Segatella copri]
MSGAKNVIDMRPSKGFSPSQGNEHLRRLDDCERAQKARWNYDPSREHLNFEVGKGGIVTEVNKFKTINQRIQENLDSRGIVNPNKKYIDQGLDPKYRTVVNFILGGNREVMRNLAFGNQKVDWEHGADNSDLKRMPEIESWAKDAYAFMCKKFGEQNIAAFVVHLDEANPHVHCTVLPLTEKNRFSFKKIFTKGVNTREALVEYLESLHTEYAEEVGLKYGMERGDSIKETGAVHRTTEEYRRKLWKDAQEKEEEVRENTKTIEQQNSTITNQCGIIASLSREIKHSAARLKALATMIKNLETHKVDLELEIKKLNRDLAAGKISKEEADRKLSQINAEIKKTEEKILDKTDKLKIAESKLHDAEQRKAELEAKAHEAEQKTALAVEKTAKAEGKYQEIKSKYKEVAPAVNAQTVHEMETLGYHLSALDMRSRLSKFDALKETLSHEQRDFLDTTVGSIFDGSLIENVAENSANLCSVAASLYLGYLNAATRIAQSCGGGGGPGTGWGKRDDENDMDFRRRCFGMAMKMMKPGRQQRLKR